jgi:tetratricopeptide (TPR) repeat protein
MKKLFIVFLCLAVVFAVGFGSYRGYKIWKQKHLITQARAFIAKGDGPNAMLCLRGALKSNSRNVEACRLMADFAQLARSPQAVFWRSRLVELEPHSLSNRVALASIALAVGDASLAQSALDGVDDADKKTALYHKAAGALDIGRRLYPEAEAHFSEAARLEPANPVSQLNLALLRVQMNEPRTAAQSRADLQALCTNLAVRCEALRQLSLDALRHTNLNGALAWSQKLLEDTNSVFGDRMRHLSILRAATNAQQAAFLGGLQAEATNNPAKAYEVAKWMLTATGQPRAALAWMKTLPPATRTNLPVPMIEADCYMAAKDWTTLQTNLVAQNWADLDCLRRACLARADRELGLAASGKTEWLAAMKGAEKRHNLLVQLLTATRGWNWPQEQEDVLWAIANRFPKDQLAVQALTSRFYSSGKTRSLLTLFSLQLQNNRTNLAFMNNLAVTAMLLEAWEKKPHELARTLYQQGSTNSAFVSTYAYSLLVQRKAGEALKTIEQLSAQQLEDPAIAGYYGLILQANGQREKAKKYFDLGLKAKLLPEERKLFDRARAGA